ncbi:MAG TPA: pyridoxamine 5'-phosphate oxidase family protein [Noviherbaspirillum sp.]|jgi:predicted pyridoxine 5'-phosphate oxidase superfamily flavin-nucleotide-binding protein|uniref:pyridoxamine 5'-phosphate oxidase family protein n=1 Tax=Noviherbaspirillum sp. TaxID=1926288 RepID=UPI002F92E58C
MNHPAGAFHGGEMRAQEIAGVRDKMAKIGATLVRDFMPDQHREFFPLLPTLLLGGRDAEEQVWASILWGEPGFIRSPDPVTLHVAAGLPPEDPLAPVLLVGRRLGALGLQFETRRRNRANGVVTACDRDGFTLAVQQSFGNCPKYIQTREAVRRLPLPPAAPPPPAMSGSGALPPDALALVRASDTFFIATASAAGGAHGADVSHRGGRPGFVDVAADGSLVWPDFQGNNFFNTIGNLLDDPRAGLLFIDFARGDLLQLTGKADIVWDGEQVARLPKAQRLLRFRAQRYLWRRSALPLRWQLCEPSPHLEGTGTW